MNMKKNGLLLALGAGLILASCIGGKVVGTTSESVGDTTPPIDTSVPSTGSVQDDDTTYLAQSIMSINLLGGSSASPLGLRKTSPSISPTIYDEAAEEILSGIEGVASIVNFNPQSIQESASDREGYAKLYTITLSSIEGDSETYSLYFNETTRTNNEGRDEVETITTLKGLAIKDGVEYTLSGKRTVETEGREEETELELRISVDNLNYVDISQEMEFLENEYEYKLVEGGRTIKEEEFEIEQGRNGMLAVTLEREIQGQEFEITVLSNEGTIIGAMVEVEIRGLGEITGEITLSKNEQGADVYTLKFRGYDKVYTKVVA